MFKIACYTEYKVRRFKEQKREQKSINTLLKGFKGL